MTSKVPLERTINPHTGKCICGAIKNLVYFNSMGFSEADLLDTTKVSREIFKEVVCNRAPTKDAFKNGRCRFHGGHLTTGSSIKTGTYSKYMSPITNEELKEFKDYKRAGTLIDEMALIRKFISEELPIATGDIGGVDIKTISQLIRRMKKAVEDLDFKMLARIIQDMEDSLYDEAIRLKAKNRVRELTKDLKDLQTAETKRIGASREYIHKSDYLIQNRIIFTFIVEMMKPLKNGDQLIETIRQRIIRTVNGGTEQSYAFHGKANENQTPRLENKNKETGRDTISSELCAEDVSEGEFEPFEL